MKLEFVVHGPPVPKGRPRFTKFGKTYTPEKTRRAEAEIMAAAKNAHRGRSKIEGALHISVKFFMVMPKGWSKKKTEAMRGEPCLKIPDLDNLVKLVLDGMNHARVWEDDSQVSRITASKIWWHSSRTQVELWGDSNG